MPEATGVGGAFPIIEEIFIGCKLGWRLLVFELVPEAVETAGEFVASAAMTKAADEFNEYLQEQQKKNRRFLVGAGLTAAAIVAGSIALNLKLKK